MTVKTYYPPGIYKFLSDIAFKHHLAIKEVETVFIRRQARELGFECFHQDVGFAKTDGKPFCKGCWTRLEQTKPPTVTAVPGQGMKKEKRIISPGKYRPLKTFLDEIEEEEQEQEQGTRRPVFANRLPNEQEQ
jgi:hypothetical protein